MDHWFTYEYSFEIADDPVLVHVSHGFDSVAELEAISTFPHRERREFARTLLAKYGPNEDHTLEPNDITCPFAEKLVQLFDNQLKCYWSKRGRLTLMFLTGCFSFPKITLVMVSDLVHHCEFETGH